MVELNEFTQIKGTSKQIVDYWKWAYSNINTNSERGIFAEFLVGSALGTLGTGRVEWDIADVEYRRKLIEVKSSAFVQEWEQKKLSVPQFNIAKKYEFGEYTTSRDRHAQIYIFALLFEKVRNIMDPLNIEQWEFYILSTKNINEHFGVQKSVSLKPLKNVCHPVNYDDIKSVVDEIIDN
ncbi:hypothetical protein [Virgibacillus litoralis]|uniref:DUF4365 domain-containing protein n=1 Tax=Virgibacillus litoralis TaxID=578221 RepID=A0ABS4H8E6_9BACI|nr:hypothetical protein [Virgibacillus litoralis]MBP1947128.1 hypothetical protein [Virgibacillus litoralis]